MLFKEPFCFKTFILTLLVIEVFTLAAIIPWAMLSLGIHYKLVLDDDYHYYPMVLIDVLLNLTPAFTIGSYVFY